MSAAELPIFQERIDWDDQTLRGAFQRLQQDLTQKKERLAASESQADELNYLGFLVAKLAYCFVKEQYDNVRREMNLRGLAA